MKKELYWEDEILERQKEICLIAIVAKALSESGRTCDEDSWPHIMAMEAVRSLKNIGALK